jgi:hypothetical protein
MAYESGFEIRSSIKKSWGHVCFKMEGTVKSEDPSVSRSLSGTMGKYAKSNNEDAYRIHRRINP